MTAIELPSLPDPQRALDPLGAGRFPWLGLYRRAGAPTLEASIAEDLADPAERTLARVIAQDGNGVRRVLAATNRRLVVLALEPGRAEPGFEQRSSDRGALAITLFFDFFRKRSEAFRQVQIAALVADDAALLDRPIFWQAPWRELCASAKAVLLRSKSFPFAAGVSYPIRSLWSVGDNIGVRFESDEDYRILSAALDQLATLLTRLGVKSEKAARWHQLSLPVPA